MHMKILSTLSICFTLAGLIILIAINGALADDNPSSASNAAAPINPIKNAIPYAAKPLPLSAVRLTGGPLKNAQDLDAKYLLELKPDRMLAFLRKRAGLEPKAEGYGGWDGGRGKQLTGHICGHYLSAVSLMYAATGDARFKQRADYIVNELKEIQDKRGDGYIGAITDDKGTDGEVLVQPGGPGQYPLRRLRPQRPVVALVRRAQNLRRAARRLSLHGKPPGPGSGNQVRRLGRGNSR